MKLSKIELQELRTLFENEKDDEEQLKLKLRLIAALFFHDLDESLELVNGILKNKEYGDNHYLYLKTNTSLLSIYRATGKVAEAVELGEKLILELTDKSDVDEQFMIYNSLVNLYVYTVDIDKAVMYNSLVYSKLYDKLSIRHRAYYHCDQGRIFDIKFLEDLAIEEHQKSIELFDEIGDLNGKAKALFTIAAFFQNKKKFEDALSFFKATLEIDLVLNNNNPRILCESQISIANCYLKLGKIETGEKYYNQALENALLSESEIYINRVLSTKTNFLLKKEKYQEVIESANKMLATKEFEEDTYFYYRMYDLLGQAHFALKNYPKAIACFEKFITTFITEKSRKGDYVEAYKLLAEAYRANKNFEKSTENYIIYLNEIEEIALNKSKRATEQFQIKFKTLELEKNSEALKLDSLKFQLQSLRSQMNPHFVFNTIASISSTLQLETIEKSKMLLNSFSRLMRANLDFAEFEKISLEDEILFLKDYLTLEKYRLGDKLSFEFNYSEDLDIDFIEIPSMLIQPYIENAIKHGVMPLKENGNIKIGFLEEEDFLICTIKDNGVGRKKALENRKKLEQHLGKSTSITSTRLKLLSDDEKENILVLYKDLEDENGNALGTEVVIKVKL